jgi:hypothetical protein
MSLGQQMPPLTESCELSDDYQVGGILNDISLTLHTKVRRHFPNYFIPWSSEF